MSIRSLAPWIGGKSGLADRLLARIEAVPHRVYAEPFVGMGNVILRRKIPAPNEAINDLNGELSNLFRIVQRHPQALMQELRFQVLSRKSFDRERNIDPASLTDIERAARFLFLRRTSYGAKIDESTFRAGPRLPGILPYGLRRDLLVAHRRLHSVTIEGLDFETFMRRYDSAETLFYLDPPYFGTESYYGRDMFGREDFVRLSGLLKSISGIFILSLNDVPQVRDIFGWADIESVQTHYGIAPGSRVARELILSSVGLLRGVVEPDLFGSAPFCIEAPS